jgi:uncharacterized membrane protein YsdA (DUF1294 family)
MGLISNLNNKEVIFLIYLIIINLASFLVFGLDKKKAQVGHWRISERALLVLGFLGGSIGILIGMVVFKHKLSKEKFYIGIPLIYILNKLFGLFILNRIR